MDMLLRRLLSQAYLFDDPSAYEAGVRDTFALLQAGAEGREPDHLDRVPARGSAAV